MSACPYCGAPVPVGAAYCPYCGQPAEAAPEPPADGPRDYSLILVSLGTCPRSRAIDVLEDILGYTTAESNALMRALPTQVARNMNSLQARYLAQALTEYGMQAAVFSGENAVDLSPFAEEPVFRSDGSFAAGALAVLATLNTANRIRRFTRWTLSTMLWSLFRPRYRIVEPPRHIRRVVRRAPMPEPVRRPANNPRLRDDRGPAGGNRGPTGGSRGLGAFGIGLVSGSRSTGSGQRGPGGIKRGTGAASGGRPVAAPASSGSRTSFGKSSFKSAPGHTSFSKTGGKSGPGGHASFSKTGGKGGPGGRR